MTHIQLVVDSLFDRFPQEEIGGGPERDLFERLRSALAESEEWPGTLRRLYQAEGCDDLALALMWISDRLESDPSRLDPGPEEEDVFSRSLRRGLGLPDVGFSGVPTTSPDSESQAQEPAPLEELTPVLSEPLDVPAFDEPLPTPAFDEPLPVPVDDEAHPVLSFDETLAALEPEPVSEEPAPVFEPPVAEGGEEVVGTSDPDIFGRLLERFLEAVQSGSDDRASILDRVRASCAAVRADAAVGEEFQRYADLIEDFLGYISDHQLLDDVRVMNLVTNIQEPFGQWVSTPEAERAGILDQALEMHRDFRTMFE